MKIRPLAKADYDEWRAVWVSYLEFYETSLKADVIDETFSRFIDNDQTRQNALVAEITGELVDATLQLNTSTQLNNIKIKTQLFFVAISLIDFKNFLHPIVVLAGSKIIAAHSLDFFSISFTDKMDNSYKNNNGIAKPICVTGSGGVKIAAAAKIITTTYFLLSFKN